MIRWLRRKARRFEQSEQGGATVEFVIVFPAIMALMLSGVELAFVTLNQAMLDRAVDQTVRDIRLGTGTFLPDDNEDNVKANHDKIKKSICDRASLLTDCSNNLKLEMISQDPHLGMNLDAEPDCVDKSEDSTVTYKFVNGQSNELMVIRACAKINPVFPTSALGSSLADTEDGHYALTATTAFVQEPQ